jgi:putative hydrolase of the HAD superfamily
VDVLLLDLDETLYPRGCGVIERTDARIVSWIRDRLGVPEADAQRRRTELWRLHGTTLRGLLLEGAIAGAEDVDAYFEHVYGVDLSDLLRPDPELRALLARLPQRKLVFTNAPRRHARNVLGLLGVEDAFEAVIAIEDIGFRSKPHPGAYAHALERVGVVADRCCVVDDTHANVIGAVRAGMRAVWIAHGAAERPPAQSPDTDHHVIDALHELEPLLA